MFVGSLLLCRGVVLLSVGSDASYFLYYSEVQGFRDLMIQYKQFNFLSMINFYVQYIENMLGKSDDPLVLKGQALDEEQELAKRMGPNSTAQDHLVMVTFHHFTRVLLLYILNEYDLAEADRVYYEAHMGLLQFPMVQKIYHIFLCGMNCFAMARKFSSSNNNRRRRKYTNKAKSYMKIIQTMVKKNVPMAEHMLPLLEAERLVTIGQHTQATLETYDKGINIASKSNFYVSVGIGCERAGEFLLQNGEQHLSMKYFRLAFQAYNDYGGVVKLRKMQEKYGSCELTEENCGGSYAVGGGNDKMLNDVQELNVPTQQEEGAFKSGEFSSTTGDWENLRGSFPRQR